MRTIEEKTKEFSARSISCMRCHLELAVSGDLDALHVTYDVEQWRTKCCCQHLGTPARCGSFLELEGFVNARLSDGP